jgi:phosphonate transport system permease protein
MSPAECVLADLDSSQSGFSARRLRFWVIIAAIFGFYAISWNLADIDLHKLGTGLPKLAHWIAQAWPPKLDEVPLFALRTAETVAMAAIGTTLATLLAVPMAILASRNITPLPSLYYPARWFLNALRGIDSFVFALLFVAAVGLGPFAGVLGIASASAPVHRVQTTYT